MSTNITPGEMSEWCLFLMAMRAYEETGRTSPKRLQRAEKLIRNGAATIDDGFEKYFTPLVEGNALFARFKGPLRQAMVGNAVASASAKGQFLTEFLPALRPKKDVVLTTFADSRAAQAIQKGALAAAEGDAQSRLQKLALVPTAARFPMHRKWLRAVAEEVGVGGDVAEETLSDAETAQTLGEELRQTEARLLQVDPLTEEGAALQEHKQDIIDRLDSVAEDSEFPETVFSAAVTAAAQPKEYLTSTGRARKLLPDKEAAMMIRGRGVIAAGAGAGKTLTLASKVVYHINELGVPTSAVVATSFSRKSAAELRRRIEKYGADLGDDRTTGGFGTTHKVAGRLMREYGGRSRKAIKDSGQNTLVRLAIEQVKMPGGGPPPEPVSFFAGLDGNVPSQADVDSLDSAPGIGLTFEQALQEAVKHKNRLSSGFLRGFIEGFFNPRGQWYRLNMAKTKNLQDPRGLTPKQKDILSDIFAYTNVDYDVWNPDNKDPNFSGSARTAAKKDKDKGLRERYDFFSKPAGEWFNLGLQLTRGEDDQETPIPLGEFKQAISKLKGKAISPSEAWQMDNVEKSHAAVYAAYEWLKGPTGETDFQNGGDFDDLLLDVSKMMMKNPKARKAIQSRFKVVLVDEAQDLNRAQHVMFGLMTGYLDPAKVPNVASVERVSEMARDDGNMTADTYVFIGDDKQCVDVDALVDTPSGTCRAGDLDVGDKVLSNRNGKIVAQTVRHAVPSQWTEGFRITTESGNTLLMSPNHRLWASEPRTESHQMIVYLMYRKDMGFRVGITNKGKVGSDGGYLNSFGGRAFLEKAERLWVIEVCESREDALLEEARISLRYGIPTTVFNGEHRDINQDRIEALFHEFGMNGSRLLEDRNLSLMYPHWMSQSYTKHGRERHTINLIAHSASNTQVSMEWSDEKFDGALEGMGVRKTKGGRSRLRRWFANYREGLDFAEEVSRLTEAQISHRLSTPDGPLREITASGLFVGMRVPVRDGDAITTDAIVSIEKAAGVFVDLDVDDASNFFAGGILTHNSIYEFRGADPEAFIDMSDLVEGSAGFTTHVLETNFRSGKNIIEAANQLISHNPKQIPMVCKPNPERMDEGGVKVIKFDPTDGRDFSEAAEWVGEHIAEMMETMAEGSDAPGYDAFGIGLRTRAEGMAYGVELIKKGMPFRSKINFFRDYTTKALLAWLTIADEGLDGNPDRINAAVLEATSSPKSNLGKAFKKRVGEQATGNYIAWLRDNGSKIYGPRSKWSGYVSAFTDNLLKVAALKGSGLSANETLFEIFDLTGFDGTNIKDSLIDKVRNDGDRIAELMANSPNGVVSEEDLEAEALAPISPLKGLLDSRGDLQQALSYVRTLEKANEKLATEDEPGESTPAITLGTMHSWKGLEVPNMIIPMVGGRFPRFDKTSDEDMASERRLAYVAITRGEDNVFVLDIPTARQQKDGTITITESPFVSEMCVPQLDAEGKMATLTKQDLEEISEEELKALDAALDKEIDAYLASPEAMTPDRKLMASWGGLLYTKKRNA